MPKPSSKHKALPTPDVRTCFVIMPFDTPFKGHYEEIHCPAIRAAGLEPKRADDMNRPSPIIADIWHYTQNATCVLADLSGKNANVFYELGLAHATGRPAVLITNCMEDVPFDLRQLRVILYDKNLPAWGPLLQSKITESIRTTLNSKPEEVLGPFWTAGRRARAAQETPIHAPKSPREAQRAIDAMPARGVPLSAIEQELVARGVPLEWLRKELEFRRARGEIRK